MAKQEVNFELDTRRYRQVMGQLWRNGFEKEDALIFVKDGKGMVRYRGLYPGGQQRLDAVLQECADEYGPCTVEIRVDSETILERYGKEQLASAMTSAGIEVVKINGNTYTLRGEDGCEKVWDRVLQVIEDLFLQATSC